MAFTPHQARQLIPDDLFTQLTESTSVDSQVSTLFAKKFFALLLYGSLSEDGRLSLRTLEEYF